MIKLLILCLLATLVTMEKEPQQPQSSNGSPSSTTKTTTTTTVTTTTTPTAKTTMTTPKTATTAEHKAPLRCQCDGGPSCDKNHCTAQGSKPFCVMMAENNTLGHSRSVSTNHSCGDSVLDKLCNTTITITLTKDHYWRSCISCCHNTDNCNSQAPEAPPANTTLSKLECPSCFALNASTCKPTTEKCAVNETKCISVTGTVKNGDNTMRFAGQGCANPAAQNINRTTLVFENAVYHFTSTVFRDATDGASQTPGNVPFTILLTSFVGLLQTKLIY